MKKGSHKQRPLAVEVIITSRRRLNVTTPLQSPPTPVSLDRSLYAPGCTSRTCDYGCKSQSVSVGLTAALANESCDVLCSFNSLLQY